MKLKEQVEKEIQSWYGYYQANINQVKEAEGDMFKLVEALDSVELPKLALSYKSIEVTFPTVGEARVLLSEILQKTSIERFIKISKPRSDRLDWGYYVEVGKAGLTIYPAEPSKDCVAVKKTNVYTSWVCEKKEA
jgi:hypothetical protein